MLQHIPGYGESLRFAVEQFVSCLCYDSFIKLLSYVAVKA